MTQPSSTHTNTALRHIFVGCAGWGIPREHADQFAPAGEEGEGTVAAGSHLERYATRLPTAEINSSFYRPHRPSTYERWAASVPAHFRFSVKLPRQITHDQKLHDPEAVLDRFLGEAGALGEKLGPILVQLPPSLGFDEGVASTFFGALRERFAGHVVCEPRHASWFQEGAERMMCDFRVGRVAADPAVPAPEAARPGAWGGVRYYRLHGSPRVYYSEYPEECLEAMARTLMPQALAETAGPEQAAPEATWCIFDNTAQGAATANALNLLERLGHEKKTGAAS